MNHFKLLSLSAVLATSAFAAETTRYETLKDFFNGTQTAAALTDFVSTDTFKGSKDLNSTDKRLTQQCLFAYEAAPNVVMQSNILRIQKTLPPAGPLFPKGQTFERAVLLVAPYSVPLADLNDMVTVVSTEVHPDVLIEKIGTYNKGALYNATKTELRMRKHGKYIAFRYVYEVPSEPTVQQASSATPYNGSYGAYYGNNPYRNNPNWNYWMYNGYYTYNYNPYAPQYWNYSCDPAMGGFSNPLCYDQTTGQPVHAGYSSSGGGYSGMVGAGGVTTTYHYVDAYGYCYTK
ncbi:MAG: hypothetical protein JST16_11565 [Bdellovibrionales bacterium]|nr:hypothetical protein [Bdellovibrionales bacterium]